MSGPRTLLLKVTDLPPVTLRSERLLNFQSPKHEVGSDEQVVIASRSLLWNEESFPQ